MDVSRSGPGLALAAAVLFGLSAPAAKVAGAVDPWLLAGLLYLGSGIGIGLSGISASPLATEFPAMLDAHGRNTAKHLGALKM
jgi:hypothetical protein